MKRARVPSGSFLSAISIADSHRIYNKDAFYIWFDSRHTRISNAARAGLHIRYVIDTHVHADHISGARELAMRTGAKLGMYVDTPALFPFTPLSHGERIDLGNVKIDIMHTPGHTPEHISLVVSDYRRASEPWFVLSGHTLMIGDVGRPDLVVEDGADALYHSVFDTLLSLPDYLEVYPGAFSGST